LFLQRKNPRRIAWTTLYRRQHKKGISEVSETPVQSVVVAASTWEKYRSCPTKGARIPSESWAACQRSSYGEKKTSLSDPCTTRKQEIAKKRTRRTVKHQRAIVGASLDVIKERRTQRPEARAAARQAAIKEGKEKKTAAESKKKAEKAKSAAGAARGQTGKIQSKMGAKGAPNKVNAKSR